MNTIYIINPISIKELKKKGFSVVKGSGSVMDHIDFNSDGIAATFNDKDELVSLEEKGLNYQNVFIKLCEEFPSLEFLDEDSMESWIHVEDPQSSKSQGLFRQLLVKSRNNLLIESNIIFDSNTDINRIYEVSRIEAMQFSINGIRAISKPHVKEIASAISLGAKFVSPIEVNIQTLNILDGQHRYASYCKLWEDNPSLKIRVIFLDVSPDQEAKYVEDKNTHNKNWAISDFKKLQETLCNPSVTLLNQFALSHDRLHGKTNPSGATPIYIRYAMAFLLGENQTKELKNGTLKITSDDVTTGDILYDEVDKIITSVGLENKGNWFESMAQAWYAIRTSNKGEYKKFNQWLEKYTFEEFLKKLPTCFNKESTSSKHEYITKFLSCKDQMRQ